MSKSLSAAAQTEFDNEVKHAFQGRGLLRNAVTVRTNVVGNSYKFRLMGKGAATEKTATQADVTPMDVTHSQPTVTLKNWTAPEYTDIFDDAEVNFEERTELAETIAGALGRRLDQLIVDALNATASPAGTVVTDIGGSGTDINTSKMTRAGRYLNDNEVDDSNRHLLVSATGLEAMLNTEKGASSDYGSIKSLVRGDIDTFGGFMWHRMGTRSEGGLPLSGSTRTSFAWHKSAVGLAIGIDVTAETNYVPTKTSWLSTGLMKANAVSRDDAGIVKLTTTEAA